MCIINQQISPLKTALNLMISKLKQPNNYTLILGEPNRKLVTSFSFTDLNAGTSILEYQLRKTVVPLIIIVIIKKCPAAFFQKGLLQFYPFVTMNEVWPGLVSLRKQ